MNEIWQRSLEKVREAVKQNSFDAWFKHISLQKVEGDCFFVQVPSEFFRNKFESNYSKVLRETLSGTSGSEVEVRYVVTPGNGFSPVPVPAPVQEERPVAKNGHVSHLNQNFTFDNFVVGTSDQFVHAAAMAVANSPGVTYNPLFIYGGVGLGKTHIINAIGNRIAAARRDAKILILSGEKFTNELVNCIKNDSMQEFKNKYRNNCDILLMDDIQFLAGKEKSQEEFFYTFNTLHELHKQIILTSDSYPKDIHDLEDRLRSRFEMGLIADIKAPDMETKLAIVKRKAELNALSVPDDVCMYLASFSNTNIRELEGYIVRLGAEASLQGRSITIEMARDTLSGYLKSRDTKPGMDEIMKAVADFYNIKISEIKSHRRDKMYALPRQIAMYLARILTDHSYPEIGEKFGGKDHSTVIHNVQKIEKRMESDQSLKNTLETMKKNICT